MQKSLKSEKLNFFNTKKLFECKMLINLLMKMYEMTYRNCIEK